MKKKGLSRDSTLFQIIKENNTRTNPNETSKTDNDDLKNEPTGTRTRTRSNSQRPPMKFEKRKSGVCLFVCFVCLSLSLLFILLLNYSF